MEAADRALLKICNALIENKPFINKIIIITGYNSTLDIKIFFPTTILISLYLIIVKIF